MVLPEPERPKSAVTPAGASKATSRRKPPKAWRERDVEAHVSASRMRWATPRATNSEASERGRRDRDGDQRQAQRLRLAARDLGEGVDRRRQRAGLAGDVRDEGDRRAELAHRLGEAEDRAGDHPGQDQRQGDEEEGPEPVGAEGARGVLEPGVDRLDREADGADHQREGHDRGGERRAGPAEGEDDAEGRLEKGADRAAAAEAEEQQVAGDDGGQDQRQVDEAR